MRQARHVVVDWGTTCFRLWVLDEDGARIASRQSDRGMSALAKKEFSPVLESCLAELNIPASLPVVICGMAGAAQGWVAAPYVSLPARMDQLYRKCVRPTDINRFVQIIPGVAQRNDAAPDVMRGEETIILGAQLSGRANGLFCIPGTHSKWIAMDDGVVTRFETAMTGEVFGLLASKSTLSPFASEAEGRIAQHPAFAEAVTEALDSPQRTLQALFSVRSRPLLYGGKTAAGGNPRLSGLLIGLELAGMRDRTTDGVTLIASGQIGDAYETAFRLAGTSCDVLDAEELVQAGLYYVSRQVSAAQSNAMHG